MLLVLLPVPFTFSQPAPTGAIEGRVQDVTRGNYLNNARVTVQGTTLSALTNEFGEFSLPDVPAGEVTVTAFYSGLPPQTLSVTVAAGSRTQRDFELKSAPAASDVVQMSAFTVSSARETDQAAIAVNEQRFAPNLKTVLAADEFGEQSENNVAEFLKLMPAVTIDYVEQDARNASLRGMPAHTTIVTSNGNQLASAASGSASRVFEFEQISINEVARVEVNKSLMPDMPAEGIGGTINLITKSAFERSRPEFKFRSYLNFNSTAVDLHRTPGPFRAQTYKVMPGWDFTYINPLTKNFGITLSGSSSTKYNPQWFGDPTWTANPSAEIGWRVPYISRLNYYDGPKSTDRMSGRIGFDWRFAPRDIISVGFSEQYYKALIGNRRHVVQTGSTPAEIAPTYVQGRQGASNVLMNTSQNDKSGTTWTPEFKYMHNGPIWKFEAGGAYSHAGNDYRADEKGFFSGVNMTLRAPNAAGALVTPAVRMDYTGNYLPTVTATYADGRVTDPHDFAQYSLDNATALDRKSNDIKKTLRAHLQRRLHLGVPLQLKLGGDIRESVRDMRETTPAYTFVGPDGRAGTADNMAGLYDIFDERISTVAPVYGQANYRWMDGYKVYDMFKAHPEWWTSDPAAVHSNLVNTSKNITETITSGFVRFDTAFFRNRLLLSGGWRFQEYRVKSQSGEVNTLGRYLQDEDGELILDPATNRPITLPGNPLQVAEATNIERGIARSSTLRGSYPSVAATVVLFEDLQLRSSFAQSINYPQLSEILAVATVSDYTATTRRVVVNKPLNPWMADNYDLGLEYYTPTGGSIALSWWRKEMRDFITTATYRGADAAEVLTRNGYGVLIPLGYEVQEKINGGDATMEGWELAFSEKLDRYLPEWGRGLTVFFNTSYKASHRSKSAASGLDAVSRRSFNWGGSYRRGRFSTTLKVNHVPEPKRLSYSATATHPMSRTFTDLDVSIRLTRRLSLFATGTNIFAVPTETYVYTPDTPDYARRTAHRHFGVQCVAGIKGQF